MVIEFPHMAQENMNGYMVSAIISLGGVVTFMGKWILSEIKALKKKVPELEDRLNKEIAERHQSDLKALRSEIESKMPCHLPDCPKRATYSVSPDHCPLS